MFENVRQDLRKARLANTGGLLTELLNPGTQAALIYRFGHWSLLKVRIPVIRHLLLIAYSILDYYARAVIGVFIATRAEIGPGLVIHTWGGIFIPPIKIGRNALLQQGVVVNWHCRGMGDDVHLQPGCKIGPGVRIGSRVRIGPNAVVMADVPDDTTVVVPMPRSMTVTFPPKYPKERRQRSNPVKPARPERGIGWK